MRPGIDGRYKARVCPELNWSLAAQSITGLTQGLARFSYAATIRSDLSDPAVRLNLSGTIHRVPGMQLPSQNHNRANLFTGSVGERAQPE